MCLQIVIIISRFLKRCFKTKRTSLFTSAKHAETIFKKCHLADVCKVLPFPQSAFDHTPSPVSVDVFYGRPLSTIPMLLHLCCSAMERHTSRQTYAAKQRDRLRDSFISYFVSCLVRCGGVDLKARANKGQMSGNGGQSWGP